MTNAPLEQYLQWRASTPEMQVGNKACEAVCYAPHTSLLFDPKGYVRSCCQSLTHSIGNITQQTLKEIWNGEVNRGLRARMRANDLPQGCLTCQTDIEKGNFEQTFARLFDVFPVPDEQPEWPQNMWFLTSNACNLECVQCYGELSSSIRKNRDRLPPLKRVYHDAFFEELREFLPHLRLSLFLGGEAFLSRENFRIWDMMIADGLSTQSHIVTNGTQFNERVVRVLTSLPCTVSISLDGATKETVESIRLNACFEEIITNIKKIQAYASVELSFCIMPQNHHEFADFLVLAERMGCAATANTVHQPPEYSLSGLSAAELTRIVTVWEARDAEMHQTLDRHLGLWELELKRLKSLVDSPHTAAAPVYLTGISSRMDAQPDTSAQLAKQHHQVAETAKPADLSEARAALVAWSDGGQVYEALLDADDMISGTQGTFAGLPSKGVNNRPLSVVLMLLRERFGEDVNILSEDWSEAGMDRTMAFTNLAREQTTMRWKVLPCADTSSKQKIFLLGVSATVEKLQPVSTAGYHSVPRQTLLSEHPNDDRGDTSTRADNLITTDARTSVEEACELLVEERWQEASQLLQRLCAAGGEEPEPHFLLGRAGAGLADWELSAAGYAGAVERGAVSHETWSGLGKALDQLGRLDSARMAYTAALELEPGDAQTHNLLGSVLVRLGQLETAVALFERAAEQGLDGASEERDRVLSLLARTEESAGG